MPDIFSPPPPPPDTRHYCACPHYTAGHALGAIWQCETCGQYWYKSSTMGINLFGPLNCWSKVRWYMWRKKAIIAEHESATPKREYPYG